ncbi:MAG: MFS transporter [Proteobacteria bacterium]|nr:MAG: MFS transporter [Pseudomonadota bacterium]
MVAGVGCLQFVLERGESDDWFSSTAIVINTIVAAISLPTFIWWELKVKNPIVNVRLFLDPIVRNGVLLMSCLGFFLYSAVFLLPIFLGRTYHYDATQTGEMFIPGSILTAMMMPIIGRLMMKGVNPKYLIFIGLAGVEACLYLMTRFSPLSSKDEILRMLFMRGFAMAFLFVPINSSILSQFKGSALGQVAGLMNLFRQLGGSMGIALVGTMLTSLGHQNYLNLVERVSLLNANTQAAYYPALQSFAAKMQDGVGMGNAENAVLRSLRARVENQVFMLSFIQLVFIIMMIFALSFIPLFLLRFKEKPVAVMDSH